MSTKSIFKDILERLVSRPQMRHYAYGVYGEKEKHVPETIKLLNLVNLLFITLYLFLHEILIK